MPQSVSIELPLIITTYGSCSLVQPVGFPEFALASSNEPSVVRSVRRQIIKSCRMVLGTELVANLVRGEPQHLTIPVEIKPPKRNAAWRDAVNLNVDAIRWQQDDSLIINYIPALELTILASPDTDVDQLLKEQIRSALRRGEQWALPELMALGHGELSLKKTSNLTLQVPTPREIARADQDKPKSKTPTLSKVATRLRRKSLRPAFHREQEVQQLARLLATKDARSVLLVGPSGVGKTAVFHQWVRSAAQFSMKNVACWATDGSRLISGQTGFGMWQQQCLAMAEDAGRYPAIIHLGNLVELCESGRLRGSGGCGSLLAPKLADGRFQAIIECTPEQLSRVARLEPRLIAALTQLRIEEPTHEQTRSILLDAATSWKPVDISAELRRKRQRKNKKKRSRSKSTADQSMPVPVVEPVALEILDRLHRRFRTDAAAPGRPLAFFHALISQLRADETLDEKKVIEAFGRQTGLPNFLIDEDVRPDLDDIREQLCSQVLGQDQVIESLVDVVATLAADLSRGDRPLASMMLIGPTGVGKTETAKALSRLIYSDVSRLVRIDMSELSSGTAVGRLIGDAIHPEGMLTSAVRAQPFSLVLLDEFEKAHPSVFDLLLQVLGEGRLTDGQGRLADFRNSIVLMTSNLGVDTFRANPLGLAETQKQERYRNHFERQVREFLRPELFNRIDRVLSYDPLEQETVRKIAELRVTELKKRDGWHSYGNEINVSPEAMARLAANGYQPQYGARPLARELDRQVVTPIAEAICDSGRQIRLNANVDLFAGDDQRIRIKTESARDSQNESQSNQVLLERATLLRRRGQLLDCCSAVRRLRNEYTQSNRRLKAKYKRAKTAEKKSRIRYGAEAAACTQIREQLNAVGRLCRELERAESKLLAKHYRSQTIDHAATGERLAELYDRLWRTLCEIRSGGPLDRQSLTLLMSGHKLNAANLLLLGYQKLVSEKEWTFQAHAIVPLEESGNDEIDTDGWNQHLSFKVKNQRRVPDLKDLISNSMSTDQVQDPQEPPKLGAYRLLDAERLTELPPRTLAIMMTFQGEAAELLMEGECGIHTFGQLKSPKSGANSVLIAKHHGATVNYEAPEWLVKRQFQLAAGSPRRFYDVDEKLVKDMVEKETTSKIDRNGQWLQRLIEQEMERRIWAELEEN